MAAGGRKAGTRAVAAVRRRAAGRAGAGRARVSVAATVGAALLLAACGAPPAAPLAPPVVLPSPDALPALHPPIAWRAPIAAPEEVSVAPDGSVVAGLSYSSTGGQSLWAFDAAGGLVPLGGAPGSAVFALSGGIIVVGPGVSDPPGPVSIFSSIGVRLWQGQAVGPIAASGDPSGSRLAVVDDGSGTGREWAMLPGGALRLLQPRGMPGVAPSSTVQFDAAGSALVLGARTAELLSPAGVPRWTVHLSAAGPSGAVVLDRDGAGVTAAVSSARAEVYQFTVTGGGQPNVLWSQPLPAGSAPDLVAAPGGRVAAVGAGGPANLALYRERDGSRVWQDTVSPPAGAAAPPVIGAVAFTAVGGSVLSVTGCDGAGAPCLVLLKPGGAALGEVALPVGTAVTLAADGLGAAAVLPAARSGGPDSLEWIDLAGLWAQLAPSAAQVAPRASS